MKNFSVMTDFKLYSYQFGSRFIALFLAVVKILMNMVYIANFFVEIVQFTQFKPYIPLYGVGPLTI